MNSLLEEKQDLDAKRAELADLLLCQAAVMTGYSEALAQRIARYPTNAELTPQQRARTVAVLKETVSRLENLSYLTGEDHARECDELPRLRLRSWNRLPEDRARECDELRAIIRIMSLL